MAISAVIDYVVTITVDDTKPAGHQITVDKDPFSTVPDKHIVFVIRNVGNNMHKVSLDRDNFHQKAGPDGPGTPIRFFGKFSDHVDAGDVGVLILQVKSKGDFDTPSSQYTYKYTVEASGLPDLDPDIETNN